VCVLVTAIVVTLALCLSLVVTASPPAPGIAETMAEASFATQAEYPILTDDFETGMRPEWQIVAGFWGVKLEVITT